MGNKEKDHLESIIVKKIRTTMIGSIADIEDLLSYLWEGEDTKDKQEFKKIFEELRESILDRGNNQIRSIKKELDGYEISKRLYHYVMKVRD